MMSMRDVEDINKRLRDFFGADLQGNSNFQVVWSEGLFEWRQGHFVDYYGDIFLREETGVRHVPKYNEDPQWILERKFNNFMPYDILGQNITYEPIWMFGKDKDGNIKDPNWRAVELIVTALLYGPKGVADRKIVGSAEEVQEAADTFYEIMDDNAPYIPHMLKHGEAVTVPSNYQGSEE
jgi:hypothetical protein